MASQPGDRPWLVRPTAHDRNRRGGLGTRIDAAFLGTMRLVRSSQVLAQDISEKDVSDTCDDCRVARLAVHLVAHKIDHGIEPPSQTVRCSVENEHRWQ